MPRRRRARMLRVPGPRWWLCVTLGVNALRKPEARRVQPLDSDKASRNP